jgi:VWFA-related protein
MTARARASLLSLGLALAAGSITPAQTPTQQPTFKAGVQLVRIDVTVLDDKRHPVRGLQASDFTVLEDGQPRPVRSFQAVDAASGTPRMAPIAPLPAHNVATNQIGGDTSRLIFILMDRSIPAERPMLVARQIADAAVDAMGPGDLAAIVTTGGGVPQNLTSDRARLHKTIAASDWSVAPSQAQQDQGFGKYDPLSDGACLCGLCVMDTIARIANDVRDVPRRKVLLFVGSNIIVQAGPRAMALDVGCEKRVRDSRETLFEALGTSGLTVHSIDPNGLASVGPAARATVVNGVENRDGRALNEQLAQERTEFMAAQGNLEVLPALTGGRTILNSNEPFKMVPSVLHESDAYYLLAFEPIEGTGEVRHDIQVKVARNGVEVHAARYLARSAVAGAPAAAAPTAATPAPSSPLERALTDLLPNQSRPLGMAVAAFAGPDREHAYVGVTLDASAFADNPGSIPLEIAVLASDVRGRRVGGARQHGSIQVPAAAAGTAFVELQTYVTLPPGDYELRAAVMNTGTQAASSVFTHVTVPAFDSGRLELSDVFLATRENAGSLPDGAPAIPVVPTTARVFDANAPAWAFLRVYRPAGKGNMPPVTIEATVLDSRGRRIRHQTLPDARFADRSADVRLPLPLKDLEPGDYVLRLDAKQENVEASRAAAFTVARAEPVLAQEHSPALDAAMAAAAAYVDAYERRISAIGAEEEYEQAAQRTGVAIATAPLGRGARPVETPTPIATRKTRAHIMTITLGERGWVSFRDVFESDGHPVRDGTERLSHILQNVSPDSLAQARQIADESARYNLDPETIRLDRTINVPMTALYFLRAANQPRSVFRLGKPERVGGIECVTLQFTEQGRPRMIHTRDDAPAQGTFWIDPAHGGRVLKTELRVESGVGNGEIIRSHTTVTYARIDKLDLWVPVVMDDTYDLRTSRQTVTGHATYSDFREFSVTTAADIK